MVLQNGEIRMKKLLTVLFIGFLFGYFVSNILGTKVEQKANAEVAGMDKWDLKRDYDFKNAVKDVISSDCYIDRYGRIVCY